MAQAGLLLDKDQFNCSICLDVLRDPVTIPCGHSYCSGCIQHYWDQDSYLEIYCCPQCRQAFNPRPLLGRNTMLAEVVERFKNTIIGLRSGSEPSSSSSSSSSSSPAGPEDVECDVCPGGRKSKAVRSCLVCLASYCEAHLQPHYDSPAFKKHKLVGASRSLQETICPRHDKLLEFYCRTDQTCVCYLCLTSDHKGHDTVLAEAEILEKQNQVAEMQRSSQRRIQTREKEVQELRQAVVSLSRSARAAVQDSEKVFSELIRSIELKRFEMRELIRVQERTAVRQAEALLATLEQEVAELRRRDAELEQLSHTEDHIAFLQSCQSLMAPAEPGGLPAVNFDPNFTFVSVMTAVSDFRGLLEEVCQGGFVSIYEKVRGVAIVVSPKCSVPSEPTLQNVPSEPTHQNVPSEPTHQNVPADTADQMESTHVTPPAAGGQSFPCLNPFLSQGVPVQNFGGFTFSTFGSKLSGSGSRHRPTQRRPHPRRK